MLEVTKLTLSKNRDFLGLSCQQRSQSDDLVLPFLPLLSVKTTISKEMKNHNTVEIGMAGQNFRDGYVTFPAFKIFLHRRNP